MILAGGFWAEGTSGAAAMGPSVTSRVRASRTRAAGREERTVHRPRAAPETSVRSPAPAKRPANSAAIHALR